MKKILLSSCAVLTLAISAPSFAHEELKTKKHTKSSAENKDGDADVAVSTTRTTSAAEERTGRDVIESRAEDRREVEGRRFTFAPMVGYGTSDLGAGIGARLGYTFETPVYLGGNFMYHTGENGVRSAYYPGAELGYDVGAGPVLLRPYAGLGAFFRNTTSRDTAAPMIYPGLTVHYLIAKTPLFVGGDARVLVPFEGSAAFALAATTGLDL